MSCKDSPITLDIDGFATRLPTQVCLLKGVDAVISQAEDHAIEKETVIVFEK